MYVYIVCNKNNAPKNKKKIFILILKILYKNILQNYFVEMLPFLIFFLVIS